MGKQGYLIDSNIIIQYISASLPEKALNILDGILDESFSISVINRIELLGFIGLTENEEEKIFEFINAANVLDLSEEVILKTIEIRKYNKIKLPDAIIAATAVVHKLTLISRNIKVFLKVDGLSTLNPLDS